MNFRLSRPFIGFIFYWVSAIGLTVLIMFIGGFLGFINMAPGNNFMKKLPDYAGFVGFIVGGVAAGFAGAYTEKGKEIINGFKTGLLIVFFLALLNLVINHVTEETSSLKSWLLIMHPLALTCLGAIGAKTFNRHNQKKSA